MRDFYPEIAPYKTFSLPVDELHQLYVEEAGNPDGQPVVVLHGGPGAGTSPTMRRYFDPARYRIILLDQRGSGQSTPHAELRKNTTWHLVADLEALRTHLGIARWIVFGGSWGSTPGPGLCRGLSRKRSQPGYYAAIFLGRPEEVRWLNEMNGGASLVFPERWAAYRDFIPEEERHQMVEAYWRRLDSPDEAVQLEAAMAWSYWEGGISTLVHEPDSPGVIADPKMALGFARAAAHYFRNQIFFEPNQLLRDIGRIQHIPGIIVQGRYDLVCPPQSAYDLACAWPKATLKIVQAGHSAGDPEIRSALIEAMDNHPDPV